MQYIQHESCVDIIIPHAKRDAQHLQSGPTLSETLCQRSKRPFQSAISIIIKSNILKF